MSTVKEALSDLLDAERATRKDRALRDQEAELTAALARWFRKQGRALVNRLDRYKHRFPDEGQPVREAVRPSDFQREVDRAAEDGLLAIVRLLDRNYRKALPKGIASAIADIGIPLAFDVQNQEAIDWLRNRAATRVSGINRTTRKYLQTVLNQAINEGWSYGRTERAITARYDEFAAGVPQAHLASRAELIAVQELGEAYVEGNMIVARSLDQAGIALQKQWLEAGDNRTCPECQANAAEGTIPFNNSFTFGQDQPPGHVGCRCDILIEPVTI